VIGNEVNQAMTSIDYCYMIISFPQSYEEAMHAPDKVKWKEAMTKEMNSLKEFNTYTMTTLPEKQWGVDGCSPSKKVMQVKQYIKQGM
jgi:hypothetical protein